MGHSNISITLNLYVYASMKNVRTELSGGLEVSAEKRNVRKADQIRLYGHLRRYEEIIKNSILSLF